MHEQAFVQAFMDSFQKTVPPAMSSIAAMLKDHIRSSLERTIKTMHLVTREEYDIQVLLLRQTQEKMQLLEERIEQLEAASHE